jgi:hypothetical protein
VGRSEGRLRTLLGGREVAGEAGDELVRRLEILRGCREPAHARTRTDTSTDKRPTSDTTADNISGVNGCVRPRNRR